MYVNYGLKESTNCVVGCANLSSIQRYRAVVQSWFSKHLRNLSANPGPRTRFYRQWFLTGQREKSLVIQLCSLAEHWSDSHEICNTFCGLFL